LLARSAQEIIGQLTLNSSFDIDRTQPLHGLQRLSSPIDAERFGRVDLLRFNIPRMGRRIDVVLVTGRLYFAIEVKSWRESIRSFRNRSVWDYGLDLKNFHEASHDASIIPILIRQRQRNAHRPICTPMPIRFTDGRCRSGKLRGTLESALRAVTALRRCRSLVACFLSSDAHDRELRALCTRSIRWKRSLGSMPERRICTLLATALKNSWTKRKQSLKRICSSRVFRAPERLLVGLNLATRRETDAVLLSSFRDSSSGISREALSGMKSRGEGNYLD